MMKNGISSTTAALLSLSVTLEEIQLLMPFLLWACFSPVLLNNDAFGLCLLGAELSGALITEHKPHGGRAVLGRGHAAIWY